MRRPVVRGLSAIYKYGVSPALHTLAGPSGGCRFEPTCGRYAAEAVEKHGWVRGTWLTARRVGRCHPWGGTGLDPVPELKIERRS